MNPKVSSPISHGDSAFFSVIHARDMTKKRLSLFLYQTQNLPLFFFSIHLTFPVLTVYRTLVTYGFNNGLSFHRLL